MQNRALDGGADAHRAVASQHGHRADDARSARYGALRDQGTRLVAGRQGALHPLGEEVVRRLEVAVGRADVDPVPLGQVAVQTLADQLGKDLVLERHRAPGRYPIDHLALEHIGAGVDPVGGGRGRLLEEGVHLQVVARGHDPVGGCVGHRDQRKGRQRALGLVLSQLGAQVEVREDVAVQDEHPFGDEPQVSGVAHRPGGAERLVLHHVAERDAAVAIAEHLLHRLRQEAAREDRLVHAVALEPIQHEGEERPVGQRHHRLWYGERQGAQPRSLAPREDQRLQLSSSSLPVPATRSGARPSARCPRP